MADADTKSRYVLAWLDAHRTIDPRTLTPIRRAIEDQVDRPRDEVEVDVWLESPGGDAHAAFKLALILRDAAARVRVVVPDYAKSAATLLAFSGDEIYFAPGSELGPLDAQMPEEGSLFGQISALSIAKAADDVARNAVDIALSGGAEVLNLTGLSRADTIDAMLRFSASFSEPLVRQLDPRIIHEARQLLNVTVRYAARLLSMTGCKNADMIAEQMVENYPTHGFVIDLDEALRVGLPAHAMRDYEFIVPARALHRAAEDGKTLIDFGPIERFIPEGNGQETGGETKNEKQASQDGPAGEKFRGRGAKARTQAR